MRFNVKYILIFISFIFSSINVYSQETVSSIDIIDFNSDVTYASGCWNFILSSTNGNGLSCSSSVDSEGTVQVLELPDPDFIIQDEFGNEITEICPGAQVNIIDNSNLSDPVLLFN